MSDRWVVALAGCAALGALRPSSLPVLLATALVAAALVLRSPALLCLVTVLLVSALAGRSIRGLEGVVAAPVHGAVVLLGDPAPTPYGVRVDVRLGHRRLELDARGGAADALRSMLAGERAVVRGEVLPAPPDAPWLVARHVAGRLRAHVVVPEGGADLPHQAANALRRTLERGAAPLPTVPRSLYSGLVLGDDRAQPVQLTDDFLGAGLTHLLAVSGQNVAFVLALAGPLLRRLRLWPRLLVTLAVITMFGLVTRFEPSVLRAAAMSGLAVTITTAGAPVTRLRLLALAVTALLVVDPLLVHSVGFRLSASAAAAITVLAPPLALALPGPARLREAVGVTLAAQLGVAPVLLATFGPLPVASLPANLLAVPVAGAVMVWGLTGGLVAGVVGGSVAEVLHLPTTLLVAWLAEVAARAARLPLGSLEVPHVAALAAGAALTTGGRARQRPAARRAGLVLLAATVAAATVAAQAPPPLRSDLAPALVRWHAGGSDVVVLGGGGGRSQLGPERALSALRQAEVRSIDLLVVADPTVSPTLASAIEARHRLGGVVAVSGAELEGLDTAVHRSPRPGAVVPVGLLEVRLTAVGDRLVVEAVPVTG